MNFLESMLSSQDAAEPMMQSGPAVGNSAPTMVENKCYHMASCVKLHTEPNVTGFNTRLANGKKAGQNMAAQLKSGSLATIKDANGNFTGLIDIVAHSMGYAYALGMAGKLKNAGYKLGKFYIIAPENDCSGTTNVNDFEEVWQYGSNEKEDPLLEQDGIAPQCSVNGLPPSPSSTNGRIYIPQGNPNRDFVGAHAISSYNWILTRPKVYQDMSAIGNKTVLTTGLIFALSCCEKEDRIISNDPIKGYVQTSFSEYSKIYKECSDSLRKWRGDSLKASQSIFFLRLSA